MDGKFEPLRMITKLVKLTLTISLLPESIRWQMSHGYKTEATAEIKKAAACNGIELRNPTDAEVIYHQWLSLSL